MLCYDGGCQGAGIPHRILNELACATPSEHEAKLMSQWWNDILSRHRQQAPSEAQDGDPDDFQASIPSRIDGADFESIGAPLSTPTTRTLSTTGLPGGFGSWSGPMAATTTHLYVLYKDSSNHSRVAVYNTSFALQTSEGFVISTNTSIDIIGMSINTYEFPNPSTHLGTLEPPPNILQPAPRLRLFNLSTKTEVGSGYSWSGLASGGFFMPTIDELRFGFNANHGILFIGGRTNTPHTSRSYDHTLSSIAVATSGTPIAIADNDSRVFLISDSTFYAFDRCFNRVCADDTSPSSGNDNPTGSTWFNGALLVQQSGGTLYSYADSRTGGNAPTLGTALAINGTALPANADGDTGQPIKRRTRIIVPVTWSDADDQTAATTQFCTSDFTGSVSILGAVASYRVTALTRVLSTSIWHASLEVIRSGTAGGIGNLTVNLPAGTLPATSTRRASQAASRVYAFQLQSAAPTVTIGMGSVIGRTLTYNTTWSEDIGSGVFTTSDISITSSNSIISATVDSVTPVTTGVNTAFTVIATVTGAGDTTFTATVQAGVIAETDAREASALTTSSLGAFAGIDPNPSVIWTVPTNTQITAFTVSGLWSISVGSTFTESDVSVSAGTVSGFTYSQSTRIFSFTLTPPTTGCGTIIISIAATAVTPNSSATQSTSVDYEQPTPVQATIGEGNIAGDTLSFLVTWDENVGTQFTNSDIAIASSNTGITASNILVSASDCTRRRYEVTALQHPNTCLLYTSPSPRD